MSTSYASKIRDEIVAGGATTETDDVAGGGRSLVGLAILAALLIALAIANVWSFVFVVGLLVSILLHELGHFLAARRAGMKVTQFFLGMGPKVWSVRRGEVEYGLRALPIGAFVRIVGMNNLDETPPEDEHRSYRSKSYPWRLLTITAGSITHMLIAIVLLFTVYATWGKNEPSGTVTVMEVVADSGAAAAGLEPGDQLVSVDGRAVAGVDAVGATVRSHAVGDALPIVVVRDGERVALTATLGRNPSATSESAPYLGVRSGEHSHFVGQPLTSAVVDSVTDLGSTAWQSVGGVIKVMNPVNIYDHLTGENTDQTTQPVTVYGISRLSSDIGNETGLPGILLTLAGINVFIGLLNMVPLLPFDGGHAAVATYERIRSRRGVVYHADVAKMVPVAMAVMAFLAFVLFAGLYLDITKPIR